METFQLEPGQPTHGYDGHLKVSNGGANSNVAREWLTTTHAYDTGRELTSDPNDMHSVNRFSVSGFILLFLLVL